MDGVVRDPQLGPLLRRYRVGAGLTQEELAQRAGLSVRAVSDMERGRTRRPFLRSLRQLPSGAARFTGRAAELGMLAGGLPAVLASLGDDGR